MPLSHLRDIISPEYRGPRAGFDEAQVIKAIIEIGENKVIGRTKLGSTLDLGQGEIRTLIKRLKDAGLITVEASGCALTPKGKNEFAQLQAAFPWRSLVDGSSLGVGRICFSILARGASKRVRNGIEQRDAAIIAGAAGALTILFVKDRFVTPNDGTDCEKSTDSDEPWRTIRASKPREGDAIIISGADESLTAEYGAWSAAKTLLSP